MTLPEYVFAFGALVISYWAFTRHVRSIAVEYPYERCLNERRVGVYTHRKMPPPWGGAVRIGVASKGLTLPQFFFPHFVFPSLFEVRSFVPWDQVHLRYDGRYVFIGFSRLIEFELQFEKVLVSTMQSRLGRELPAAHVQ